jgi:predicted regulator of Ras-like GTPase activity (Roadblock/LC7/MglB family)
MFRDSLQHMLDRLDGGVAGILMGFDGISVESYTKNGEKGVDIQTLGMELAYAFAQIQKAVGRLDVGALKEITLKAEELSVLVHLLNQEYFIACVVRPSANFGRARYLLRMLAPKIQADL